MAQTFDSKLPKTTTYWTEGQIFFVKNDNFFVSEEEGHAMAELLVYAMQDPETKGLVIDNRDAGGVWPKQINEIWQKNSQYSEGLQNKKIATLTNESLATMQVNRLSRAGDIHASSRVFNSEFNDEVRDFLLG